MKPVINETKFGSITIDGIVYNYDVLITLSAKVEKREKKLSKVKFGTSHKISLEEIEHIYEDGAKELIIGTGQMGCVKLSDEAADFLQKKQCDVELFKTPRAVEVWDCAEGGIIGLFHVTC